MQRRTDIYSARTPNAYSSPTLVSAVVADYNLQFASSNRRLKISSLSPFFFSAGRFAFRRTPQPNGTHTHTNGCNFLGLVIFWCMCVFVCLQSVYVTAPQTFETNRCKLQRKSRTKISETLHRQAQKCGIFGDRSDK